MVFPWPWPMTHSYTHTLNNTVYDTHNPADLLSTENDSFALFPLVMAWHEYLHREISITYCLVLSSLNDVALIGIVTVWMSLTEVTYLYFLVKHLEINPCSSALSSCCPDDDISTWWKPTAPLYQEKTLLTAGINLFPQTIVIRGTHTVLTHQTLPLAMWNVFESMFLLLLLREQLLQDCCVT